MWSFSHIHNTKSLFAENLNAKTFVNCSLFKIYTRLWQYLHMFTNNSLHTSTNSHIYTFSHTTQLLNISSTFDDICSSNGWLSYCISKRMTFVKHQLNEDIFKFFLSQCNYSMSVLTFENASWFKVIIG